MSDNKSKMPDFSEISTMAGKFCKDIKTSITEIVQEYKAKRASEEKSTTEETTKPHRTAKKEEKPHKSDHK